MEQASGSLILHMYQQIRQTALSMECITGLRKDECFQNPEWLYYKYSHFRSGITRLTKYVCALLQMQFLHQQRRAGSLNINLQANRFLHLPENLYWR
jgi:hypothetical protein